MLGFFLFLVLPCAKLLQRACPGGLASLREHRPLPRTLMFRLRCFVCHDVYFTLICSACRDVSCMKCGTKFAACVSSGRAILDETYVRCKGCRHKAYKSEMRASRNCPLCHCSWPKTAGPAVMDRGDRPPPSGARALTSGVM